MAGCGFSTAVVRADDFGTNQLGATLPSPTLELDEGPARENWETRFCSELVKNQSVLFDRLGPASGYALTRETQVLHYRIHEEVISQAQGAIERVLQNSAQETALAMFPVAEWMELLPVDRLQGFAERLLEGSFGSTAEQEIGDLPLTYSASESWWRRAGREGIFRYGVRPRTKPYLFVASDLGRFDDRPLLSLEARARYLPFDRFQMSLSATAPLPYAFELSLSAVCEPMQFSHTGVGALRLERVVGTGVNACAAFLGVTRSTSGTGVIFGFSKPW
jgi:hypothetical protein